MSNERDCLFCKYDNGKTARQGYEYPCNLCDGYSHFEEYVPDTNVGEWISVKDRLPDSNGNYLTYYDGLYNVLPYSTKHKRFNAYNDVDSEWVERCHIVVTHWMPLPEPPKGE